MTRTFMQAAVLYGARDARIEQVRLPALQQGEVRVKIEAALTCGTDVKVFRRGEHARMIRPPALFGHEWAGTIEETGPDTPGWKTGDRVAGANSAPCLHCFYCSKNHPELCEDLLFLNGAYAEAVTVPARIVQRNLYRIPADMPAETAALAEPLACVVHGLQSLPIQSGETAAVLGLGPIGLMFVKMCVLAGARVIAVGRRKARLCLAEQLGAAYTLEETGLSQPEQAVRALTEGGHGPDRVIEAAGTPQAWQTAIGMVRKAGIVHLFGGCAAGTTVPLDTHRVHYDALTLQGAFHHTPASFQKALQMLQQNTLNASALLSTEITLAQLPQMLARLAEGEADIVKAVVRPGS